MSRDRVPHALAEGSRVWSILKGGTRQARTSPSSSWSTRTRSWTSEALRMGAMNLPYSIRFLRSRAFSSFPVPGPLYQSTGTLYRTIFGGVLSPESGAAIRDACVFPIGKVPRGPERCPRPIARGGRDDRLPPHGRELPPNHAPTCGALGVHLLVVIPAGSQDAPARPGRPRRRRSGLPALPLQGHHNNRGGLCNASGPLGIDLPDGEGP